MKNLRLRLLMTAVCLVSIMMSATVSQAAPIAFNQVLQIINAKPDRANAINFTQLRLANNKFIFIGDGEEDKKPPAQQDERAIVETRAEVVEDDVCDCELATVPKQHFPYAWHALGAVPLLFLIPRDKKKPTPTPVDTPPVTTITPTPTPPDTTPTPPPEPEPMTILLFETGLASVGMAARRKFGKKDEDETEK
ncbi:MAG: hypothetical protein ABIP06_02550 [Pyrinomonadaceae bacterium]